MIYIASPYSSPLVGQAKLDAEHGRYMKVLEFVQFIMLTKGPPAFSPIVYCHPLFKALPQLGSDAESWMKFNNAFLRKSEAVFALMLPGWNSSKGMTYELKMAQALNIPVVYYNDQFEETTLQ